MQCKIMRDHSFIQTGRDKEKDKIAGTSIGKGKKNLLMYHRSKIGTRVQGNQIICNKSIKNMHTISPRYSTHRNLMCK